jgi:hypothetical protein
MPAIISVPQFMTFSDLIEHGLDYLGGTADEQATRDCARAARQAYNDLANARLWQYLMQQGQILTDPPSGAGTIAYNHGGLVVPPSTRTHPRCVTLSGAVWPVPAAGGTVGPGWMLRVDTATYQVESYIDPTHLTLTIDVNPMRDIPAGTPYTLYHDGYLLPADFARQDTAIYEGNFGGLQYSDPTDYLWNQRYVLSAGTPRFYTVVGSRAYPGELEVRFWPYPTETRTIGFIYQRQPRTIQIQGLTDGTVSVTMGSTQVQANGFVFPSTCPGAILRLGTPQRAPDSWIGANPPSFETYIQDRLDPLSVVVNDPSPFTGTYAYVLSDRLDVELNSMLQPILRGVEKYLQTARNIQGKPDAAIAYSMALKEAQAADSRSFQGRCVGGGRSRRIPHKYMPADFWPS